jgi:uncharacterized membrane-anchored protein YitT (DUF2179 family)
MLGFIVRKEYRKYLELTIGVFLAAIAFNLFFFPLKIVIGGTTGVAIIGEHLFNLRPSIIVVIYYIITLILGFVFLGRQSIINSLYGSMLYPIFMDLTYNIGNYIAFESNSILTINIIGAVIMGVAYGLIYKTGFTTGGVDIIRLILNKYFGYTMGKAGVIINGIIVIIGGFIFGTMNVMYAIIVLFIMGIVTDRVLLGTSTNKAFYIVAKRHEMIRDYIIKEMNRGVSILKAKHARSGDEQRILMCVVPTKQYFKLKEGIKLIDKEAFFIVMDAYEVKGGF